MLTDERFCEYLNQHKHQLENVNPIVVEGRLTRMIGMTLEAVGCNVSIGERCQIETNNGKLEDAEVVGFDDDKMYLMPVGRIQGLGPGARVIPTGKVPEIPVGNALLGRVLNGQGQPIDDKGPIHCLQRSEERRVGKEC